MRFNVITLFPDLIQSYLKEGVVGRATQAGGVEVSTLNPRQFTSDIHQTVDDRPFGGGDGMLLKTEPLTEAVESLEHRGRVVLLSPHGKVWNSQMAQSWAQEQNPVTLICGRYAGVDQRFINEYCAEQISVGDFVLSGGELAALAIIDSVSRFVPGVLGNAQSCIEESFQHRGLLECPQFTRPQKVLNQTVPQVLLSGDHKKIEKFKFNVSLVLTTVLRPELVLESGVATEEIQSAFKAIRELNVEELKALGLTLEQIHQGEENVRNKYK